MTYILAFIAGVAGAAAGYVLAAALGAVLAPMLGIPSFEGAAAYFAGFLVGPIGGLLGLVLGLWLVFRYKGGYRGFSAIAGRSAIVIAGIALLVVVGIQIRLATVENFPGGRNPQMDFEIRLPASAAIPNRQALDFEMQAGSQRSGGLLRDEWLRHDGERPVLVGFVQLFTRTSQRMLVVSRPGEPKLIFQIRLSATPTVSERYGEWRRVDFVDDMKADSQPRRPGPAENFEIRYRVPDWTKP
jgi:MFS family permease